jgi:Tfp pilus assembly protein PilW
MSLRPSLMAREDGFTLIELLVAILYGVVVTGALFAILEVSLRQTSRVNDRVQATQLGRTAMTNVVDELQTACLARKFAPIQATSTANKLIFITGTGEETLLEYKKVFRHEIAWTGTYPGVGKLTDKSEQATSGTWPTFSFTGSTPTTRVLAEYAYNSSAVGTSKQAEVPVFKYYKYATKAEPGTSETPVGALTAYSTNATVLTTAQAEGTSAVLVSFATAPTNNYTALGRPAEFHDLVTFAFASPSSEASIVDGPCQ